MTALDGPLFVDSAMNAVRPDLPFVERDAITAIVRDPATGKFLGLKWKEVAWETLISGGIEEGQTAEEAARAEIREETGYQNLKLVRELSPYHSQFFHHPKGVNRFAHYRCFLFDLLDHEQVEVSDAERSKHEAVWLTGEEMKKFDLPEGHRFLMGEVYSL